MLFGDGLVIWILEGSIPGLLLLCRLKVGEVCGPATPTSSPEFLVRTGTNLVCNKYVQFQLSTANSSLRMDYQARNMLE
jgi:hypothetical protein